MSTSAQLTIAGSGTALEGEYAAIREAMARCATSTEAFDPHGIEPRTIEAVREMWLTRMEFEHHSAAVFAQLSTQLMEANATLDAKVCMTRMAQDEFRHSETCGLVVRELGGTPARTTSFVVAPLARHPGCSPEERALRNVIYTTCMSEMNAIARFVDSLEAMRSPYLRDRTRLLLSDEILHGQFGFHYLEAWQPWLDSHPDVVGSIERYLRHAFVTLEAELAPRASGKRIFTDDEIALGMTEPSNAREMFYATVESAIVPGLEQRGIDAGKAWRTRRLEPSQAEPMPPA